MDEAARGFRFGALAHRNFRLFFLGQGVSLIGTWMQNVAQGWLVLELTNSPFYVGLVSALGSLGVLLLTIYAGVVADRTNKHRLVILTQSLSMIPAFVLAALVWTRRVAVWHVAALAAFLGLVNAFDIPARQAFIVELVGKDDLVSAIALNSSAFNGARVIGPAVAGAVIGMLGVGVCFFLNGVSYLAVIGGLLAMRLPPYVPRTRAASVRAHLREVVTFIGGDRRIATVVVLMALFSICGFPYLVMMPVFARDVLHRGAAGYGVMMTCVGLGALTGALAVALFDRRIRKGPTLLLAGGSFGALLVAFALSRAYPLSLVLLALTGGTMIVNNALANVTIQTIVPDELRGRVMGFYAFVFVGLAPLGAFLVGALAERVGTPRAGGVGRGPDRARSRGRGVARAGVAAHAVGVAALTPPVRHPTGGDSCTPRPASTPRRARRTKSTRNGPRTRNGSGPKPAKPSIGTSVGIACSTARAPRSTAGFRAAWSTRATTRSIGTSSTAAPTSPRCSTTVRSRARSRPSRIGSCVTRSRALPGS